MARMNSTLRLIASKNPMTMPLPRRRSSREMKVRPLTTAGHPMASQTAQENAMASIVVNDSPGVR